MPSITGIKIGTTTYDIAGTNTDTYPTGLTWTNGTTAGPVPSITRGGTQTTSVTGSAIPAASNSASGVVTVGGQEFSGTKVFRNDNANDYTVWVQKYTTRSDNYFAGIGFRVQNTTDNVRNDGAIWARGRQSSASSPDSAGGANMGIECYGNLILGSGGACNSMWTAIQSSYSTAKNIYIASNAEVQIYAGCATMANRKGIQLYADGYIFPRDANGWANGAINFGSSDCRFGIMAANKFNTANFGNNLPSSGSAGELFFVTM